MRKIRVYNFEDCEMWMANDYEELSELFMALNTDDSIFSEPMQSTGLKDKNGKEIFEGDIVKYKSSYKTFTEEVAYNKDFGGFGVMDADADIIFTFGELHKDIYLSSLEVIGNVYENYELFR